jgi:hypothetical protein
VTLHCTLFSITLTIANITRRGLFSFLLAAAVSIYLGYRVLFDLQRLDPSSKSISVNCKFSALLAQLSSSTNTNIMGVPKRQVGYFTNWGIYGRKFPPSMIPAEDLT